MAEANTKLSSIFICFIYSMHQQTLSAECEYFSADAIAHEQRNQNDYIHFTISLKLIFSDDYTIISRD